MRDQQRCVAGSCEAMQNTVTPGAARASSLAPYKNNVALR